MAREYAIYDVFCDSPLSGNPLAVVFDAAGLDTARMQAIAGEFHLSETVFVLPPAEPSHKAALRIFTPGAELPFAGHPTVGAAIALAERHGLSGSAIQVLEEKIGPVRAAVTLSPCKAAFAEFDLPRLPELLPAPVAAEQIAAALNLDPQDVGFENHRVNLWSAGVPFLTVPVAGLSAMARARLDAAAWRQLVPEGVSAWLYSRETVAHDCAFHARMFAPGLGIVEDPATGAAVAAFCGQILQYDGAVEGPSQFWIEQGIEMGRPSRIRLETEVAGGRLQKARIGGHAVLVAAGQIFL